MNHNIKNKIADYYIQIKVEEELKKCYTCYIKDDALDMYSLTTVRAENEDEIYLKLFKEYDEDFYLTYGLIFDEDYSDDPIIQKYLERAKNNPKFVYPNEAKIMAEMTIDDEDINHMNWLKINYLKHSEEAPTIRISKNIIL